VPPGPSNFLEYWFEFMYLYDGICIHLNEEIVNNNSMIISVMSMRFSNVIDRGFEPPSGQTKDYKIGICCFCAKHTALRRKSKDWLAQNQNNVSEWSDSSAPGLLFQWASTMKISPPLTACTILVIVIDSSFVEQVEEPGIYLSKYWLFWNFGIQYKVDNSQISSFIGIFSDLAYKHANFK
jgi:hypothetical protein